MYDSATGHTVGTSVLLADEVHDAALNSPGTRAAAVTRGPDGSFLHVWDVATGQPVFPPAPLAGQAVSVVFRPDDAVVAVLSTTGEIRLIDAAGGAVVSEVGPANHRPARSASIRFAGLGTLVAYCGGDLQVYDARTGRRLYPPIHAHFDKGFTAGFAVSDDGRHAAVAASALGPITRSGSGSWPPASRFRLACPIPTSPSCWRSRPTAADS